MASEMQTTLFANAGVNGAVEYGATNGTNTVRGTAVGLEPAIYAAEFLNAAREAHHKAGTTPVAGDHPKIGWVSIEGEAIAFTANNPQMPGPGILLLFGGDANLCVSLTPESALALAKQIRDALGDPDKPQAQSPH